MKEFRSNCPLARSLDIVGDKWTLLILRDISAFGKTTFKEISQMQEKIATNTLSDRLERLTGEGLITKTQSKKNKLVYHYNITEKGLELVPVVKGFMEWSMKYKYHESEMEDLQNLISTVKLN